jgi:hypothetical protein
MNIEINTSKVNEEKDKLSNLSERLIEIEKTVMDNTEILKSYWQSKTADKVYTDFDKFKKDFDTYLDDNNNLVEYLQNIVVNGYKEYDDKVNKAVDGE